MVTLGGGSCGGNSPASSQSRKHASVSSSYPSRSAVNSSTKSCIANPAFQLPVTAVPHATQDDYSLLGRRLAKSSSISSKAERTDLHALGPTLERAVTRLEHEVHMTAHQTRTRATCELS